jgi:hypothetical protein
MSETNNKEEPVLKPGEGFSFDDDEMELEKPQRRQRKGKIIRKFMEGLDR